MLLCSGVETYGRWGRHSNVLVRQLARHKAAGAPAVLKQAILQASRPSAATAATAIDLSAASSSSSAASSSAAAAAPGAQVITLTQKQKAAVDQLVGLGFGFDHALEVFMACGGNEQQAANILLEQMG